MFAWMKRQPGCYLQMWPLEMVVLFKSGLCCTIKNKPLVYLYLQENENKHNFAYLSAYVIPVPPGFFCHLRQFFVIFSQQNCSQFVRISMISQIVFFSSCVCRHERCIHFLHCFAAFHLDVLCDGIITFWLIQVLLTMEKHHDWCLWRMRSHRKKASPFLETVPITAITAELSAVIAKWWIPGGATSRPCALNVLGNEKIKYPIAREHTEIQKQQQ